MVPAAVTLVSMVVMLLLLMLMLLLLLTGLLHLDQSGASVSNPDPNSYPNPCFNANQENSKSSKIVTHMIVFFCCSHCCWRVAVFNHGKKHKRTSRVAISITNNDSWENLAC